MKNSVEKAVSESAKPVRATFDIVSSLALASEQKKAPSELKRGDEYMKLIKNVMEFSLPLDASLLRMINQWVHRLIELFEKSRHPGYESLKENYYEEVKYDNASYPKLAIRDLLKRTCIAVELGEKIRLEKNLEDHKNMERKFTYLINGIIAESILYKLPVLCETAHKIYEGTLKLSPKRREREEKPQEKLKETPEGQSRLFIPKEPTSYLSALTKNDGKKFTKRS